MRKNSSALRLTRGSDVGDRPHYPEPASTEPAPQSRFDIAAERAMARYSAAEWVLLEPVRRTGAIYEELRRLDAELGGRASRAGGRR